MGTFAINPSMVPVLWKAIGAEDKNHDGLIIGEKEGYKPELDIRNNGRLSPNDVAVSIFINRIHLAEPIRKALIASIIKDLKDNSAKPDFIATDWHSIKGELASKGAFFGTQNDDFNALDKTGKLSRESVMNRALHMAERFKSYMTNEEKATIQTLTEAYRSGKK